MSIVTSLCNHLGATQIQVYGITIILSQQRRLDKYLRIIGTELHDERAVLGTGLAVEVLAAVVGVPQEDLGVAYWEHIQAVRKAGL